MGLYLSNASLAKLAVDVTLPHANNSFRPLVKNAPPLPSFDLDDVSAPAGPAHAQTVEPPRASRASFADATVPLSRGERVADKYLLVRHIGKGGMADVWEAQHEELKRSVAIKFLLPELLVDPAMTAAALTRFRFEAQVSAQLCERSRHIVAVYDFGSHRGQPYLVMELLPGRTLEDEITARGKLPAAEVAVILDQTAHALRAAHDLGIVHRDLKPSNLLLAQDADGAMLLKLTDFGVAKAFSNALAVDQPKQTTAGSLVGSPAFMSPEQVDDRPLDARSDIWSLGAVVYEALSGAACFDGPSLMRVLAKIAARQIVPIRERVPELPPAIDGWFDRALAVDVAERFADVEEMAAAFRAAISSSRTPAARRSPKAFAIGAAIALLAAIGAGIAIHAFSRPAVEGPHGVEANSPQGVGAPPPSAPRDDTPPASSAAASSIATPGSPVRSATQGAPPASHAAAPSAAPSAPPPAVSTAPAPATAAPSPAEPTTPRPPKRIDPSEYQ